MSREAMIAPITDWLVERSLGNVDIIELFDSVCMKMIGVGIPIVRARLIWPTLHPLFQAETVIWNKGQKPELEQFSHQDNASDAWNRSPLKFVIDNDLETFRRELDGPNELLDFQILKELKEDGFTDYLLLATRIEGTSFRKQEGEKDRGILVTFTSDKPGGFSGDDLWALQKIQKRFAVACKTMIQPRITANIARTYLGARAGKSVLNGQIRRGDGERINAVVWFSDMRNSTGLAETMAPDDYFSLLNSFFLATAEPVADNGGEVLDFIGDAVLGIFPFDGDKDKKNAARAASNAVDSALSAAAEINSAREGEGEEKFKFGIGLNVGEVQFGNIGIPSRLSFSVIGPTVNEAARIEAMTKYLQQPVLANAKLANLVPDRWKTIGEHKLDGVLDPVELYSHIQL